MKFSGRVAEEFKLRSGTWVAASKLRSVLIDLAAPLIQDAVICGLNREFVAALVWLNENECDKLDCAFDTSHPVQGNTVVEAIRSAVNTHNLQHPGSSTVIKRIKIMNEPLSPEKGELSDKGSVNSRLVLDNRAGAVARMFETETPDSEGVIDI